MWWLYIHGAKWRNSQFNVLLESSFSLNLRPCWPAICDRKITDSSHRSLSTVSLISHVPRYATQSTHHLWAHVRESTLPQRARAAFPAFHPLATVATTSSRLSRGQYKHKTHFCVHLHQLGQLSYGQLTITEHSEISLVDWRRLTEQKTVWNQQFSQQISWMTVYTNVSTTRPK